jgi:hypothetical protein
VRETEGRCGLNHALGVKINASIGHVETNAERDQPEALVILYVTMPPEVGEENRRLG